MSQMIQLLGQQVNRQTVLLMGIATEFKKANKKARDKTSQLRDDIVTNHHELLGE